jgi:hypothetical protein
MGHRVHQLLAILCVASFLALVALGSSDLIGEFCLQTLSFGRPHDNRRGPFWIRLPYHATYRAHHARSRVTHKIVFTAPAEPSRFSFSVVTPLGYKAGVVAPAQPTYSHTTSHHYSASFPTTEKREKIEKQI